MYLEKKTILELVKNYAEIELSYQSLLYAINTELNLLTTEASEHFKRLIEQKKTNRMIHRDLLYEIGRRDATNTNQGA